MPDQSNREYQDGTRPGVNRDVPAEPDGAQREYGDDSGPDAASEYDTVLDDGDPYDDAQEYSDDDDD